LYKCGGGLIADGRLLDLIRRISTFDLSLLKLDIRQARKGAGTGEMGYRMAGITPREFLFEIVSDRHLPFPKLRNQVL